MRYSTRAKISACAAVSSSLLWYAILAIDPRLILTRNGIDYAIAGLNIIGFSTDRSYDVLKYIVYALGPVIALSVLVLSHVVIILYVRLIKPAWAGRGAFRRRGSRAVPRPPLQWPGRLVTPVIG